ncbi:MAG TPA: ABC-F family ATP-binding cassette domain-containing protein [Pyrinomonadaceae bacterium]|nr:ABC-F family ATP-binding cassette domain-containing protein [Pyrinomonadaceae bacterium]
MLFRLSNVTKSYAGHEILRGVTFQVNPGEKIGLVGRNGAGKTTVFDMITGAQAPDTGDVVRSGGLRLGLLTQHVDFAQNQTVHTAALSAFKEILEIESEMRDLEVRMASDHSDTVMERYAELQHSFEQADGFTYASRAEAALQGLGFPVDTWDTATSTLSGGQKNRLGLVRVLLSAPDVLLLDEPTNHLDVNAVEWLENFLANHDGAFVVISHDRYFLDRISNRIIEIDNGKAVSYKGNYSKFLTERALRREQQQREYENQQQMIAKTQEFIRRNLEGQKTKQAKSRRNMLERLERLDAVAADKSGGNFGLKKVERTGNNVLTVEDLAVGYGTKILASGIKLTLHRGEALGIIGGNGTGKTTFLKTLLGEIRELSGTINWGTKTNIGYYSQNLETLDLRNDVINELRRVAPLAESGALRSFLAGFLFFGDDVFKSVSTLSGGEKGRLALAKLIYSGKNVLVLDEPTNHLDIPSREALENALAEYDGTVVTVSHDRYFLDKIATQMLSINSDGSVDEFNGNYTDFHDWKEKRDAATRGRSDAETEPPASAGGAVIADLGLRNADLSGPPAAAGGSTSDTDTGKKMDSQGGGFTPAHSPGLSKNQRNRFETRIKEIEQQIPILEKKAAELSLQMAQPQIASDFGKLKEVTGEHAETEKQIHELYDEWERITDVLGSN